MSLSEAKCKITATEFMAWAVKIQEDHDREWDRKAKWEYYLANATYRIDILVHVLSNLFAKNPNKYEKRVEDFLLDFTTDLESQRKPEPSPSEIAAWSADGRPMTKEDVRRMNESKAAWMGSLGLTTTGKSKEEVMGVPVKRQKPPGLPPAVIAATEAAKKRKLEQAKPGGTSN